MKYLKLPLIALSLAVPLVIGNINPAPVLSAPLITQNQTDKAYQLIEQGMDYLSNQQWDYALYSFNQAISIAPSVPYGYIGRATAMLYKAPEPTLVLVKSVEGDLQIAISLMSPTKDGDAYQSAYEILKIVQATRTILELSQ
jgi:tetratricopeptide (TPR) repeat protein